MRVVAGVVTLFLAGGTGILAQTAPLPSTTVPDTSSSGCVTRLVPHNDGNTTTATECRTATVSAGCPIVMHVGQRAGGTLVETDDHGRRVERFAARLRLDLNDPRSASSGRRMVKATVTVQGLNPNARAVPLDAEKAGPRGTVARTMTVTLENGELPGVSADLWLPGFTAAQMVQLESVVYDDGQVWRLSGLNSCRVAPDLYMPVNGSK